MFDRREVLAGAVLGAMLGLRSALAPSRRGPRLVAHDYVAPNPHGKGGPGIVNHIHVPYVPPFQVAALWGEEDELLVLPPAVFLLTLTGDDSVRFFRGDALAEIVPRWRWHEFRADPSHPWPFEGCTE